MRLTSVLIVAAVTLLASTEAASESEQKLSTVATANAIKVDAPKRFLRSNQNHDDPEDPGSDDNDQNDEERMISVMRYFPRLSVADDAVNAVKVHAAKVNAIKANAAKVKAADEFPYLNGIDAKLMKQIENVRGAKGRINNWLQESLSFKEVKKQFGVADASDDMKKAINLYSGVDLSKKQSAVAAP